MADMTEVARRQGQEALTALDELPDSKPLDTMKERLADAIEALIHMRDELIAEQRAGNLVGGWLARTNEIISTVFGTEFPVGGLAIKRIEEARTALRDLLSGARPSNI